MGRSKQAIKLKPASECSRFSSEDDLLRLSLPGTYEPKSDASNAQQMFAMQYGTRSFPMWAVPVMIVTLLTFQFNIILWQVGGCARIDALSPGAKHAPLLSCGL